MPACSNCTSRPEVERCDYSMTRDYHKLSSRYGRRCRQGAQPLTPEPPDRALDNDLASMAASEGKNHDQDQDDQDPTTTERLREKLERLERMIGSLMESHNNKCRRAKELANSNADGGVTVGGPASHPVALSDRTRRLSSSTGDSMWSNLLSEVGISLLTIIAISLLFFWSNPRTLSSYRKSASGSMG